METYRLVPAVVVAGLAVVGALVTGSLIDAAEDAVKVQEPSRQASPVVGSVHVAADLPVATVPVPRTSDPTKAAEAKPAKRPAAKMASDASEADGLFDVVPRPRPVHLAAAKDAQGEKGKQVYQTVCFVCHQPDGRGVPGVFPMLAQSDYLAADRSRAIHIVLNGLSGPVIVNGQTTNGAMPALGGELADQQIADVLTYVFNAWENPGGAFTADQVGAIRIRKP